MTRPEQIQWLKPSGHGPSSQHLVREQDEQKTVTWCGREVLEGRELLEEGEADGECSRCVGAYRRHLLDKETVNLEELAELEAITPAAADVLDEHEIPHTEVDGSGEYGRITKEDAVAAARAREGVE